MKPKSNYEKAYDTLISIYHDNDELVNELHDLKILVDRAVPKYVKAYRDGVGDATIPNGVDDYVAYRCPNPNCDTEISDDIGEPNFCYECGQALKWWFRDDE